MRNKKGFTLVELMVAATIIGILVVFATTQYRNSAAETRWTQAKAKADQLAYGIERAKMDYPNVIFTDAALGGIENTKNCGLKASTTSAGLTELIGCGYLENSGWSDDYFEYYSCDHEDDCTRDGMTYTAFVQAAEDAKLPSHYKTYKYYTSSSKGSVEVK